MKKRKRVFLGLFIVLAFISVMFSNFSGRFTDNRPSDPIKVESIKTLSIEKEKVEFFGIDVSNLKVTKSKVKWGQSLSILLDSYHYDANLLVSLAKKSRQVFDVRKISSGKTIAVIHTADTLKEVKHIVYEPNAETYVIYSFNENLEIKKVNKPIDIQRKEMSGIITSSLYEAVIEQGGSAALVDELVDILAWQVDFFSVQKNDKFKVIFTEKVIDDQPVGIHEISAAFFESSSNPFYAYQYCQGTEREDYFDDEGNSVRKAFLRAPLKYSRISSRYNPRRFHPVQKRYKAHLGTDYAAPTGTPIRTVGDGVIVKSTYTKNNGNYVKVKHNSTYSTQYLHMSRRAKGMRKGVHVKKGQIIGYVGSTGLATGPHLCYRFWKNGVQVDALKVKLPASKPIRTEYRKEYFSFIEDVKAELDRIPYAATKKAENNPGQSL